MASEKKTDAPLSVEELLKTLYELQMILSEIDRIRTIRGDLPIEVKDLEDTVKGLKTRVKNYMAEIDELNARKVAQSNTIINKRLLIDRYSRQLDNVRNNHEFDNLTKEVEYEKLQIILAEKIIGETERTIEMRQAEIAETEANIEGQLHILEEKKADLDNIISETRQEEEVLIEKAKKLEPKIEERILTAFKRIRKNARNGLGIVAVDRNACGGCFNRIPPQKQIEIKMHKKVIVCEYCGRIMIDPELALAVESKTSK